MGEDPDKTVPKVVTPSAGTLAVEKAAHKVAENRSLIRTIRAALREEGLHMSGNSIARIAKLSGRAALVLHVGFAASDGHEEYKACKAN